MSNNTRGPWHINQTTNVYDNPWLTVEDHAVTRPDGEQGQYGVVHFKNRAIGVLPIDDQGHTWIVGQHRFPMDLYSWELPEGGGPLDEPVLDSAKRELAEETGLTAAHFHPLLDCYLSNSVTDERCLCYLAWDLTQGDASPEGTEILEKRRISFVDLLADVISGKITDSLTIMMVMSAYIKAERGLLPREIAKLLR